MTQMCVLESSAPSSTQFLKVIFTVQGLWGPGSPFEDFKAFLDSMKSRGVSFLEMLAMEMKSEGYYVARGLSFT